jgi:aspartate/methionine/tyrosine aminotransferase
MYPSSTPWEKELKASIVKFEKKYRGVEYSPENVVLGPGVAGVLSVLHYAILEQGDEVITWDPSHHLVGPTKYWPYIGARPVPCRTLENEDWKPDLDEMQNKITSKTKAIFINSPNNPTGAIYDEKVLKGIVNVAGQHGIPVISDEIYGLITFDGAKAPSTPNLAPDVPVIMLSGMSKTFMRTGWRVGYICIHDPREAMKDATKVIKRVANMYGQGATCIPTPILAAAAKVYGEAVEKDLQEIDKMIRELQLRKDYTMKRFREMSGIACSDPKGALYAFPRVQGMKRIWQSDDDFMLDLLKEEGLVFDPGSSYGRLGESHFRTLIMPKIEILERVYNKLEKFLERKCVS